jgi:hypothetical protein
MNDQNQEQQQQIEESESSQQQQEPLQTVHVNVGSFAAKYRSKRGRYPHIFF